MIGIVFKKEMLSHLLSQRFAACTVLAVVHECAFSHLGGVATRYAPKASQHTDKQNKGDSIMKVLTIRILYIAVFAAWFAASSATATETPQYGGFSSHPDSLQVYLDYLNSLAMIKVEAGDELRAAVEAIPFKGSIPTTSEQEADLRGCLYDFLVAFSVSGSDSLAAEFYLREGVEDSAAIQKMKKDLESGPSLKDKAMIKMLKVAGVSISIPEPVSDAGNTPLAILKTQHRQILAIKGRDYFFGNISFFGSAFEVLEMQGQYDSYMDYAQTHGLIPKAKGSMEWPPKLREEIEKKLQEGEQRIFAQFMFIVEEPEECADFETGPMRFPFFARLAWSPKKNMWRLVEIFASNDAPVLFVFKGL